MHTSPKTSIKVIGAGNAWRGDDAAGLLVVRRLQQEKLPQVQIVESPGSGTAIANAWKNAPRVIVVDAVVAGGAPGTIYRIDAHDPGATLPVSHTATTHGWGLSEALALGKVYQNLPPVLIIYGIEGANFGIGESLSPPVAAAIPETARRIIEEIQAWLGQNPPGDHAIKTGDP
jgi:hydrogenase maturation protease